MEILKPPQFGILPRQNNSCTADPVPIHSPGVWDLEGMKSFLDFSLPRLQTQLAVIFILTQSLYLLLKRFHLPRVASEILAGLILGPTILGRILPSFTKMLFPPEGDVFLNVLSKIGFIFFMFMCGVRMDPSMVTKTGKKAWTIGFVSVVLPVVVGMSFSPPVAQMVTWSRTPGIRFVIATQTLTPFPVVARLLIDLHIMNSELGHLALASALVRELVSGAITTFMTYVRVGFMGSFWIGIQAVLLFLGSVSAMGIASRKSFWWIIRQTPEGKPVKSTYIVLISVGVFFSAVVIDNLGVLFYLGPLMLGLAVPDGPPLGSTLEERLDTLVSGLFAPLFLSYCGLHSDLLGIRDLKYQVILWTVLVAGAGVKFTSNFIPAMFCRIPLRDATALSLILSAQGIVEMASYLTYKENDTLDGQTFSGVTSSVFLSSIIIPLLVQSIYDYSRRYGGYQKRNILHTHENSELRILACAHRPEDAMAAIKLLEASNPSKETPIAVYALHLMELVGRASPILINHQLGQKSGLGSRSLPITKLFQHFEFQYSGSVVTQAFTAVSLTKFMHEDICSLAFEKLTSLIILPFHRKWNSQGNVVFDSDIWKNINRHVLQLAPCSVAILVDRRRIQQTSAHLGSHPGLPTVYRVGVVFLGGDDDREALAYAKRMARSPNVFLTVVRFFLFESSGERSWEEILDTEILKELRIQCSESENVYFREEKVEDGPDLALKVHAMEDDQDLVVVGRRHSQDSPLLSGLTGWVEFPELGPVGDILAEADVQRPVSVLVVQRQLHMKIK